MERAKSIMRAKAEARQAERAKVHKRIDEFKKWKKATMATHKRKCMEEFKTARKRGQQQGEEAASNLLSRAGSFWRAGG